MSADLVYTDASLGKSPVYDQLPNVRRPHDTPECSEVAIGHFVDLHPDQWLFVEPTWIADDVGDNSSGAADGLSSHGIVQIPSRHRYPDQEPWWVRRRYPSPADGPRLRLVDEEPSHVPCSLDHLDRCPFRANHLGYEEFASSSSCASLRLSFGANSSTRFTSDDLPGGRLGRKSDAARNPVRAIRLGTAPPGRARRTSSGSPNRSRSWPHRSCRQQATSTCAHLCPFS